jgi:Putative peptidoglycan binding domain/N-terminal TM domain of oligopeptide transport permease C
LTMSSDTLAKSSESPQSPSGEIKSRSHAQDALLRLLSSKSSMIGLTIFVLMILVAVFAPLIARYDPTMQFRDGLHADGSPVGSSAKFWLGTDALGRDLYSRLLYGARSSMEVAASLERLGYLQGETDDETLLDALSAFIRTENFEEREQERGYLDRAVFAFMRENTQE